jgi:hypothetical protein
VNRTLCAGLNRHTEEATTLNSNEHTNTLESINLHQKQRWVVIELAYYSTRRITDTMSEDVPPDKNAVPTTTLETSFPELDRASPVVQVPVVPSSPSYVSSTSSMSTTATFTPTMNTIDSAIRKNSDDVMSVPPVHPFFKQQQFLYDSDGSDGR